MRGPLDERVLALANAPAARLRALVTSAVPEVAPTLTLAVRVRGELVVDLAVGWADPHEHRSPADPDLRFDVASLTKLVTTTLVLQLVSAGGLALDDPLSRWLDWFGSPSPRPVDGGQEPLTRVRLPTPRERRSWLVDPAAVTVRQLLSHTSGLAPWRSLFDVLGPVPPPPGNIDPVTREERWATAEAAIRTYPFVDRPGASVRYSDLGFILLGMLAVRLTGRPFDALVRDRVAVPLELGSLVFRPLDVGVPRTSVVPTSHDRLWRHRRSWGEAEDENATGLGGVAGHAGLFATATDIAAFGRAWLDGDERLGVGAALRTAATTTQAETTDDRRGLGWQLRSHDADADATGMLVPLGLRAFGHTGFTGSSLAVDPDRGMVVACLTNRVWHGRDNDRVRSFLPRLHRLLAEAVPAP